MLLLQKLFSCQEPRLSLPIKQKFVCLKCQSIKYYNKLKWTLVSTSMILKIYLQRTRMSHNGFKKKELSIYLKKIFQKLRYYINEVTFCGQSVDGSLCEMFSARCIKSPLSVNQWFVAFWSVLSRCQGCGALIYIRPLHIYTPFVPHYSRNYYVSHFHGIKARFNAAKMIIHR